YKSPDRLHRPDIAGGRMLSALRYPETFIRSKLNDTFPYSEAYSARIFVPHFSRLLHLQVKPRGFAVSP
ncbi:MAG: hypothetical protein KDI38_26160, partial [Calditrichaeota bacterium]|nr:hypothetical protein [Calditrichota bacterium]